MDDQEYNFEDARRIYCNLVRPKSAWSVRTTRTVGSSRCSGLSVSTGNCASSSTKSSLLSSNNLTQTPNSQNWKKNGRKRRPKTTTATHVGNQNLAAKLQSRVDELLKRAEDLKHELKVAKLKKKMKDGKPEELDEVDRGGRICSPPPAQRYEFARDDDHDMVVTKMTLRLERAFESKQGKFSELLRKAMTSVCDKNGKLMVSKHQLRDSLEREGIFLTGYELQRVIDAVGHSKKLNSITYRRLEKALEAQTEPKRKNKGATRIQAIARGSLTRKKGQKEQRGVLKLQSLARGRRARKNLKAKKTATIYLQSRFRGYLSKKKYVEAQTAARNIQRHLRGHLCRCKQKALQQQILEIVDDVVDHASEDGQPILNCVVSNQHR